MRARFEIHVKGRALRIGLAGKKRVDLGMALAIALMRALADDFVAFDHDGAHQRIRMRLSAAGSRKEDRPLHEMRVFVCHYFLAGFSVLAIRSRIPFTNLEESDSP